MITEKQIAEMDDETLGQHLFVAALFVLGAYSDLGKKDFGIQESEIMLEASRRLRKMAKTED